MLPVVVMTAITPKAVAERLGVNRKVFGQIVRYIDGFPAPCSGGSHHKSSHKRYDQAEIEAWLSSVDAAEAIKDAQRRYRTGDLRDAATRRFLALSLGFLSGRYDPPDRQRAYALRRLTARTCKPKTERIPARSDWALESK